jgi:hypothetical protein
VIKEQHKTESVLRLSQVTNDVRITLREFIWTDHVRNEEVLHRVEKERNILHTIKRRKANWIGHILRRNCLLKHVIEEKLEGRIEMTGR